MNNHQPNSQFGCHACLPFDAAAAYDAFTTFTIHKRLVDQSHFMINIRCCCQCKQNFICIFTETIDWVDGEDPQYRTIMPITVEEASHLAHAGITLERTLAVFAPNRVSLSHDFPKGASASSHWSKGIYIRMHD
jgi:hypothetical protein